MRGSASADDTERFTVGLHLAASRTGDGTMRVVRATWRHLRLQSRPLQLVTEAICAFGVALALTAAGALLDLDPISRVAQVSILAHQQFAAAVVGIVLIAVLLLAASVRIGRATSAARRLVWASTAGIASGVVGGGTAAALHGTPWPLYAANGDSGQVLRWAYETLTGTGGVAGQYPPGAVNALVWTSQLFNWELAPSQKFVEIVGVSAIGPLAYLAWRMLLPPSWAAAVGFASSAPFLDPYKPLASISLVVATPTLIALILTLRKSRTRDWRYLFGQAVLLGAVLGLVFLTYSGWFVWCAPGVAVAGLFAFPWSHWRRGLVVTAASVGAFAAVSATYLVSFISSPGVVDKYKYFDTSTDPAYFAAWLGDLTGPVAQWPPYGEFGGVGLFTIGLAAGLGAAIALGWRSWAVRTTALVFVGAWLVRFWIAGRMASTGLVQLYPRTSTVLLHCTLILGALALCLVLDGLMGRATVLAPRPRGSARSRHLGWTIGALTSLVLVASSVGSATVDRYLPATDGTVGLLAWVAQNPYTPEYASTYCRAYLGAETCPP